ncbi:MAG: Hpt domain-containing protein [Desulfobacteraceae bacterium]|nr:Hpt domain-containing protein [Desulfobacteraceae bacterium]
MNFKKMSKILGLEEDEYLELVELFIETSKSDLKNLQSAINNKNMEMIAGIAHSLKGAAMNLGLDDFIELAKTIEKTARDGELEETVKTAEIFQEKLDNSGDF